MREFAFELDLCARLEGDGIVARQLGSGVRVPGTRVIDVVQVEPGPAFGERAAITPERIPEPAIEAEIPTGQAVPRREAFADLDLSPERQRAVIERASEIGFLERERRRGREYVRRATDYPEEWFGSLRAIENKPDLGSPGDLERQLRFDVALSLFEEVILATASHVTRAHLNRIPPEVGVWRVGEGMEVVREPGPLPVEEGGVEIVEEAPSRFDVVPVSPEAKAAKRRRIAERAYGKGFRTYEFPACGKVESGTRAGSGGLPYCAYHDRLVDPAEECGPTCPGYDPADPPEVDRDAERDAASPWRVDPEGRARTQSGLDRFG